MFLRHVADALAVDIARVGEAVVQASASGLVALSPGLQIVEVTERAAAMLGFEISELTGASAPHPFWDPARLDATGEVLRALMAGDVAAVGLEFRRRDGEGLNVLARCATVRDSGGAPALHILSLDDIGSQLAAEDELEQRRAQLEAVINAVPTAVWSYGPDGSDVFVSERWTHITGQAHDEWRDGGWKNVVHPGDRARLDTAWHRFLHHGEPFEEQYRILRADNGEERVVVERGLPLEGVRGIGFVGMTEDVTARIRAEATAEARFAQLDALARTVPSAVWAHGLDESVLFSNNRWQDLTGQPSAATALQGWAPVIHPDDLDRVRETWRRFEVGPATGELRQTYRIVHASTGEVRTLKEHALYVRSEQGAKVAIAGATYDISDEAHAREGLVQQIAELEALTATLPSVVWRFATDGAVTYCSDQWEAITGQPARSALGDGWQHAVHPDDLPAMVKAWRSLFDEGRTYAHEYRVVRPDGEIRWLADAAKAVRDPSGAIAFYVGTSTDITERRLRELHARRRAEQQAAVAALGQAALEPSATVEDLLERMRQCVLVGLPEALCDIAGAGPDVGADVPVTVSGSPVAVLRVTPATGTELTGDDRAFLRTTAQVVASAIERRHADDAIRHQAMHDSLTGLPNRTLLLDRLGSAIRRAGRREGTFAVLFMDLDNFKVFNDSLGHDVGDDILIAVAQRLQTIIRPADVVARLGGDEFVVLCDELRGTDEAAAVAERIVLAFGEPLPVRRDEIHITVSIGIATPENSALDATALLRDADAAMYTAKRLGRSRVATFSADMRVHAVERLELQNALRRALERDQLVLHYQPVVSLGDGSLSGFEALVRWRHPERGLIPPGVFIPIAEETGLIVPIGRWIIQEACRTAARWNARRPDDRPLSLAINISGWQLQDPTLPTAIMAACDEWGLDVGQLALEITETVLLSDNEIAPRAVQVLSDLGCRVLLDDFGTGYSSLAYLQQLPLGGIKLDRSFIANIAAEPRSRDIVRAVTAMARALDLTVIAEGIEEEIQADILRELGCAYAQGFHFSRPVEAEAAIGLARPGVRFPAVHPDA